MPLQLCDFEIKKSSLGRYYGLKGCQHHLYFDRDIPIFRLDIPLNTIEAYCTRWDSNSLRRETHFPFFRNGKKLTKNRRKLNCAIFFF